jgi:hypothetical protein
MEFICKIFNLLFPHPDKGTWRYSYDRHVVRKLSEHYAETFEDLDKFMEHLEDKFNKLREGETYEFIGFDDDNDYLYECLKTNGTFKVSKKII